MNGGMYMPLQYKVNVLTKLKNKGYNTNRIRTEALLSQSTLQKLREGKGVSWDNIETLCRLIECQPGDLIEYLPDTGDTKNPED
jgi:DNA-binding Xre family transcriptional regulator